MLEVEKLLDTVLLVLGVCVVLGLLCLGDSLNTLIKVVLEIVARTLSGGYVSMFVVVMIHFNEQRGLNVSTCGENRRTGKHRGPQMD